MYQIGSGLGSLSQQAYKKFGESVLAEDGVEGNQPCCKLCVQVLQEASEPAEARQVGPLWLIRNAILPKRHARGKL